MSDFKIDIFTLDDHLVDVLSKDIPKEVSDKFWALKEELGSLPMGIAYYPDQGWYIVDSMGSIFFHFK